MNSQGLDLKERSRLLAKTQAKHCRDKENRLLSQLEESQTSLLLRVAPHNRGSASSYNSTDSTNSSSSWASSTGGGGGRVRQMFAARNRAGVDKSAPLDPIVNNKKGKQTSRSLDRGRKGTLNKRKEGTQNRSQSEIPSLKPTKKPTNNKTQQKRKPDVNRKSYVFKVAPNNIKANMPQVNKISVSTPKFTAKAGLVQCKNCTRNFASDRIETHRNICKKTSKKRKPFDVGKARVEGTDAANFVGKSGGTRKKKTPQKSDWRKKREEFVSTLRAAKEAQRFVAKGGNLKDLPPPPPMDTSHYVQCPHCSRK